MHFRPTAAPRSLKLPGTRTFFRNARMGGTRQVLFLPFVVVKLGRGRQAGLLRREVANARAARASAFWSDLAMPIHGMGAGLSISRRHGAVGLDDFDAIAAIAEARLASAAGFRRAPALAPVEASPLLAALPREARCAAEAHLRRLLLPVTGMHGDFHMFNFCRPAEGGFGVLDWEHYDARGSFAVDYVEFHTANRCFSSSLDWRDYLAACREPDASARRAGARLGVDAEALWLLYLLLRFGALVERIGGFDAQPPAYRETVLDVLRRQTARLRRNPTPAEGRAGHGHPADHAEPRRLRAGGRAR